MECFGANCEVGGLEKIRGCIWVNVAREFAADVWRGVCRNSRVYFGVLVEDVWGCLKCMGVNGVCMGLCGVWDCY